MSEAAMMKLAGALKQLDPEDPCLVIHAWEMAKILVPVKVDEVGCASYFKDAGRAAVQAFVIHLKTAESACSGAEWRHLWEAMKKNPACEGLVMREAKRLELMEMQAPEEFSAVISTLQLELRSRAPLPEEGKEEADAF